MSTMDDIREGMQVYGMDEQMIGKVEKKERNGIVVGGQRIATDGIDRIVKNRVYIKGSGQSTGRAAMSAQTADAEGTMRVPVREERLDVSKRQTEAGEVRITTTIEEEQVSVPVDLRREEVHVEEVNVTDRRATDADMANAFEGGTIRVPVQSEEAYVTKSVYVTGEVTIDKEQTVERQDIRDTVRRERITVDEDYEKVRPALQQHFQKVSGGKSQRFEDAEEHYQLGYATARDKRYSGMTFEEIEPDLREQVGTNASGRADDWTNLRERVREGWERARRS